MEKNNRMSIFVSSPNSYSDIFKIFYECYKKYWSDCIYEFILSTNNQSYKDITVINNYKDNDNWTDRTVNVIKNINTKYIMLFCDDIFIIDKVDNLKIEKILDYMDNNNINFCRLEPVKKGTRIKEVSWLSRVSKHLPSAINLQYGIFNRNYLIELLGDGTLDAWSIEKKLNKDMLDAKNQLFEDVIACNSSVIEVVHGISKGKWYPSALKKLDEAQISYNISRDIISSQLEKRQRLFSAFSLYLTPKMRKKIKHILSIFGFEFVTEN
jgi:hypothetical protein